MALRLPRSLVVKGQWCRVASSGVFHQPIKSGVMNLKPMGADQGRGLEQVTAVEVAVDCCCSGVTRVASLLFSLRQDTPPEALDGEPSRSFPFRKLPPPLWDFPCWLSLSSERSKCSHSIPATHSASHSGVSTFPVAAKSRQTSLSVGLSAP